MHPRINTLLLTRTLIPKLCMNGQKQRSNSWHLCQSQSSSILFRMTHTRTLLSTNKTIFMERSKIFNQIRNHSKTPDDPNTPKVTVKFIHKDGEVKVVSGPVGMSILDLAHANEIDLEGACEGALACSTCHVIVKDPAIYNKLGEPTDEENDMLDLAFGLTETSRLGCQIKLAPELEGMELILPAATRNMAVDGYKPKPH